MEAQRAGVILNVSSVAGTGGAPLLSAYAAAKHGVIGLTRSAALEYARFGIRINAICPSFAATPMVTEGLAGMREPADEATARMTAGIPMRRLATAEEVVQAMLWICSPANSFMTGHALAIDGGLAQSSSFSVIASGAKQSKRGGKSGSPRRVPRLAMTAACRDASGLQTRQVVAANAWAGTPRKCAGKSLRR